jgi:hypothetical protein
VEVDLDHLVRRVRDHSFWLSYLKTAASPISKIGVHLAVFREPFLSLVLNGPKTVESRFSRNRCAPFGEVEGGDIILLKEVSGPIRGIGLAKSVWFYDLAIESLDQVRDRFGETICADDEFWESRRTAAYATLIELAETATLEPFACDKRDRRGWVSLRARQLAFSF